MTRAVLVLTLLAASPSFAFAGETWAAGRSDVGPAPWIPVFASQAFGPEDAYLFAEPDPSPRLAPDAEAAAYLVDQQRMAETKASARVAETGRVAVAFSDFVSYGPDGQSYGSIALVRSGGEIRVAWTSPPVAPLALAAR